MRHWLIILFAMFCVQSASAEGEAWPPEFEWSGPEGISAEAPELGPGPVLEPPESNQDRIELRPPRQGEDNVDEPWRKRPCAQMKPVECRMFRAINRVRRRHGLHALRVYRRCVLAAQAHARHMDRLDYFDHHAPEESWYERMIRFGLDGLKVGENIAQVSRGLAIRRTIREWMRSLSHRRNILDDSYHSSGVGYSGGRWVQCFSAYSGD